VKLSVSLPDDDIEFLDRYGAAHGVTSRSGVLHRAVSLLRAGELGDYYAAAWEEWADGEAEVWEPAIADGLS
jgi:hypothetical protein